jgi:hypothetical protein
MLVVNIKTMPAKALAEARTVAQREIDREL